MRRRRRVTVFTGKPRGLLHNDFLPDDDRFATYTVGDALVSDVIATKAASTVELEEEDDDSTSFSDSPSGSTVSEDDE